jgi:mannosyl-oligosaccharide glucosidase
MADLSQILSKKSDKYTETFNYLMDNDILNEQHLSPITGTYSDWGFHTDAVTLQRSKRTKIDSKTYPMHQEQQPPKIRVTKETPEFRFVDTFFGYVSLFPFLLEIVSSDSPALSEILLKIRDPNILWTNYGLRSLSKSSPMYMKWNTEHDPPYWRGPIWININYLALKALYYYSSQPGPYMNEAKKIYVELRHNVVNNMILQYKQTGYIWEQYDDKTGSGKGCRPFTGWSSLVVLMMAEEY